MWDRSRVEDVFSGMKMSRQHIIEVTTLKTDVRRGQKKLRVKFLHMLPLVLRAIPT